MFVAAVPGVPRAPAPCTWIASASPADKAALVELASRTERGKRVPLQLRREIQFLVERIEKANPTPRPATDDAVMLDGTWDLLYTGPALLDGERDSWSASGEERPLGQKILETAPAEAGEAIKREGFVRTGRAFQSIDVAGGRAQNKVELGFGGPPPADGSSYLAIDASFAAASDRRVNVVFERALLKLGPLPFALPLPLPMRPRGWLETTYLDGTLRIGRGDKGSLFVLTR